MLLEKFPTSLIYTCVLGRLDKSTLPKEKQLLFPQYNLIPNYTKEKVTVFKLSPPCRHVDNLAFATEGVAKAPVGVILDESLKFTFQNIHCCNDLTDGNIDS